MILILSRSHFEPTTDEVIDWIQYYDHPFIRINGDDFWGKTHVRWSLDQSKCNSGSKFVIPDLDFDPNSIGVVWYRRSELPSQDYLSKAWNQKSDSYPEVVLEINNHARREVRSLTDYFISTLSDKVWLSRPSYMRRSILHKFNQLILAKESGLSVPKSICTTRKTDVIDFYNECNGSVITKAIGETFIARSDGEAITLYTSEFFWDDVCELPSEFAPTLFQEKIEKESEYRCFYLDGEVYAMCIHSQRDAQTAIDFRRYNYDTPNIRESVKLPSFVESSIRKFMQSVDLLTGSVDLVYSTDGEFIFLEVNPVGQFGMVSKPCGYQLEKRVAEWLIRNDCVHSRQQQKT